MAQSLWMPKWSPSALVISGYCGGFPLCCLQELAHLQRRQIPMMDSVYHLSCSQGWSARVECKSPSVQLVFTPINQPSTLTQTHTHYHGHASRALVFCLCFLPHQILDVERWVEEFSAVLGSVIKLYGDAALVGRSALFVMLNYKH